MVEFAPNQKAPPEKKKVDSRHATIQQGGWWLCHTRTPFTFIFIPTDEDYLSFIASLQNPPAKQVEVDVDALCKLNQFSGLPVIN